MTDCPECNKPLAEADRSCTHCGWPHEEEVLAEQAAAGDSATAAPAQKPMIYLATGLGVGLLVGIFIGSSLSKDPPAAEQQPANTGTAGSPAGAATAPPTATVPSPIAVRLRELSWNQTSDKLCTGRFEVISAPPSVRVLKFAVTDAGGKVIGNDSVSAAKPVKPGTVLELGFEVGKCSAIDKWQVEVPETK